MADNTPSSETGDLDKATQQTRVDPARVNKTSKNLEEGRLDRDGEERLVPRRISPLVAFMVSFALLAVSLWGPTVLILANDALYHNSTISTSSADSTIPPGAQESMLYDSVCDQVLRMVFTTVGIEETQKPTLLAATYVRAPDTE